MSAITLPLAPHMVVGVDAYCPLQTDPIGFDYDSRQPRIMHPLYYIVWIRPRAGGRRHELAPRLALHVTQPGGTR